MFKKILILSAALAMALAAVPALAAIEGTVHEYQRDGGPCAQCHLPHGAVTGGLRLWPSNPFAAGIPAASGSIGPLCGYCHFVGGGWNDTNVDRRLNNYIYQTGTSHGMLMGVSGAVVAPRGYNVATALPYVAAGTGDTKFECTSCHDVHNDPSNGQGRGYRPFLRADMDMLCTGCHTNRMFQNGTMVNNYAAAAGSWGAAPYTAPGTRTGVNNSGSHPVGKDIDSDRYGAASPIQIFRTLKVAVLGTTGWWQLGGHLTNGRTGGVMCVTCHAVHGVKGDSHVTGANAVAGADSHFPYTNFLVVQQGSVTDQNGRSVANGQGNANDALCEACHQGATLNAVYAAGANTSTKNPNPGGTQYGHPVDNMLATSNSWVTAFPTNWPTGSNAGGLISLPNVICESCHVAHPLANIPAGNVRMDLTGVTQYQYILRGSAMGVCNACHTVSMTRHHPVGDTYTKANVLYLNPGAGVTGTTTCGTCHGGAGAHNYITGRNDVGMNPNWKPYNNGRYASMGSDRYNRNMSQTCMDCHYGLRGSQNPTRGDVINTVYSNATETDVSYANIGFGTHALGRMGQNGAVGIRLSKASKAVYWGSFGAKLPGNNPETATWTAPFGGNGGWSRFGGDGTIANTVLVCESCHELEITKNSATHLLLGTYTEEISGQQDTRTHFCEACHNPSGTHPQSGDNVGTQGNHVLNNIIAGRTWLTTPNDPNIILNPVNPGIINCNSCHQPHQAATLSRTFIIDCNNTAISATGVPALQTVAQSGSYTVVYGATFGYFPSVWTGKGPDHQRFCSQCHPY